MQFGNAPTTMMQPQTMSAMPPAPQVNEHQKRHETIAKLLPLAGLAGLYVHGHGGVSNVLHSLNKGSIKGAAGGMAATTLQNQAKGTINDPLAANLIQDGVHDFNDVPMAADAVTKAINPQMEAALGRTGGFVNLNGYQKRMADYLDNELTVTESKRNKALDIMNKLSQTPAAVQGRLKQIPNRSMALQDLRPLEAQRAKLYSQWQTSLRAGKPDEELHSLYGAFDDVIRGKDGIKERIFSDEKGAPIPLDDMTRNEMLNQLAPLKSTLPDVYDGMSARIRGAGSLMDARHLMADFTQASIAHDKMAFAKGGGGGGVESSVLSNLAHGPGGIPGVIFAGTKSIPDTIAAALLQSHGVNVGATSLLSKIAR